mgnify:CR=1 FL=1
MALADFGTVDSRRTYVETDYTVSKSGAETLKLRIEAYWRERGHVVQVVLEEKLFNATVRGCRYDVRSNLLNGFPPKAQIAS